MTDTPFAPFLPMPPATQEPPKTETKTKGRHKRVDAINTSPEALAATKEKTKREKKASLKAHAPKFELQTILAVASTLNDDDFPAFEKLIIMLDEAGKPQRDRLLAAIGKVFG